MITTLVILLYIVIAILSRPTIEDGTKGEWLPEASYMLMWFWPIIIILYFALVIFMLVVAFIGIINTIGKDISKRING